MNSFKNHLARGIQFGAVWLLFGVSPLAAAPADSAMLEADKLIDQGKITNAAKLLQSNLPSPQSDPRNWARFQVMLARCQNLNRQYAAAAGTLDAIRSHRPSDWHLEQAHALFGQHQYREALAMTDYYEKDASFSTLHRLIPALWIRAASQMKLEQYRPCMNTCRKVTNFNIDNIPQGFTDYKLSPQTVAALKAIKQDAGKLYYQAREAFDVKTYGKNFAVYRKAREAQFSARFKDAEALYCQIDGGALKDAAGCYIGECMIAQNSTDDAQKLYTKLIAENPTGLYRGEMMYKLAIIAFLDGKPQTALSWSAKLRDWCSQVQKPDAQPPELAEINPALHRDIIETAPKTFLQLDSCGNLIASAKYPETINNRLTSPWYLPELTIRAELLHGFLLGEKDAAPEAAQIWEKMTSLTSMQIIRDRYALENLKAALQSGSYLFSPEIAKSMRKLRKPLRLAGFLYLSDNKSEAEKLFDTIAQSARQENEPADYAAARLGKMYCQIAARQKDAATQTADAALSQNDDANQFALLEMRYLKACLLAQSKGSWPAARKEFELLSGLAPDRDSAARDGRRNRKSKKSKRAESAATPKPFKLSPRGKNYIAPRSLLAFMLASVNHGNPEDARKICREMSAKHSGSIFSKAASTLLSAIASPGDDGAIPVKPVETATGKVFLHRRVIVFPGAAQWVNLEAEAHPGDIVLYQIKFISRNPCSIVRGVWINLDAGEPSPPDAAGNEIHFVRAPILFQPFLQYDLPR